MGRIQPERLRYWVAYLDRRARPIARFVRSPGGTAAVFLLAVGAYAVESLALPVSLSHGRDADTYILHYLQLADSDPPFPRLMVFRTPVTGLFLGPPLQLGGVVLLEFWLGLLFAVSIVAYFRGALYFGALPATLCAFFLLAWPPYGALFHQASSDPVFAFLFALWVWLTVRVARTPSPRGFAASGAMVAVLVLTRPPNAVFLGFVFFVLFVPVSWRRRAALAGAFLGCAAVLVLGWALHNGIRYGDFTISTGRAFPSDQQLAEFRRVRGLKPRLPSAEQREKEHARQMRRQQGFVHFRLFQIRVWADKFWFFLSFHYSLKYNDVGGAPTWSITRTLPLRPHADDRIPLEAWVVTQVGHGLTYARPTATSPALHFANSGKQRRYLSYVNQIRDWEQDTRVGSARITWNLNKRVMPKFPPAYVWLLIALLVGAWRRIKGTAALFALLATGLALLAGTALYTYWDPLYAIPVVPLFIMLAVIVTTARLVPASQGAAPVEATDSQGPDTTQTRSEILGKP
jgi:hypothetical protein